MTFLRPGEINAARLDSIQWANDLTAADNIFLEPDEIAFVVGSVAVDFAYALRRRQRPGLGPRRIWRLLRSARSGPVTETDMSTALGIDIDALNRNHLFKFDRQFKDTSFRFNFGDALVTTQFLPWGLIKASQLALTSPRRRQISLPGPKRVSKKQTSTVTLDDWDDLIGVSPENGVTSIDDLVLVDGLGAQEPVTQTAKLKRHGLEIWEDDTASADWLDDLVNEPEGANDAGLPNFLINDDLADEVDSLLSVRQKADAKKASLRAPKTIKSDLQNWLTSVGHDNSGVRIEAFAEQIVGLLSEADAKRALNLARANDGLQALRSIESSLLGSDLRPNAALHLRRLISVHQCLQSGIRLPAKRHTPAYTPVKGRIFYLIHMRDPWEVNGYVSRTHLILASMRDGGMSPMAVTRLGFPNDLARHRKAIIPDSEMVEGVEMMSMRDPRNGQLGRPLDTYIEAYADRVVELAKKYKPAAIHAASNYMNGLAAISAGRKLGIPSIYEVRGIWEITQASANDKYAGTLRYAVQRRLENQAVQSADRIITISGPLQKFVIEHGAIEDRVSIVPNGVDSNHFRPAPPDLGVMKHLGLSAKDVVIGYVGSIVRYEGLDYVIRALRMLLDRGVTSFRFLVVGDGSELAALKKLAAELKVSDVCIFTGRVPRSQVEQFYSVVDIVPLPRRSLPVTELVPPLKPFEAMASGKAVIVSSVAAIADTVIHEQTGLIVEKDNVEDLAKALRRLIENKKLRKSLGANSRIWVERERSVSALARELIQVYESVGAHAP